MLKRFLAFALLFVGILNQVYAYSGDLEQSLPQPFPQGEEVGQESSPQPSPTGEGVEQIVDLVVEETSIGSNQSSTGDTDTGSGAVESSSGTTESGSGEIELNSGVIDEYSDRFQIVFQNPSYLLDKDLDLDNYTCDDSQDKCKVNFNIDDLELSTFSSKFSCKIDFGFTTGEENKCNPNTVIFGTGTYQVLFQIFQNEDNGLIWEKTIEIINEISDLREEDNIGSGSIDSGTGEIETSSGEMNTGSGETSTGTIEVGTGEIIIGTGYTQSGSLETNSGAIETGSGILGEDSSTGELLDPESSSGGQLGGSGGQLVNSGTILEIPEPFIEVQSGLNYLTGSIWQCKKEDCKINLTGESSFSGSFTQSDYECLWSFSGGSFNTEGTEKKCNPGYVDYGTGIYEVSFKVSEKGNSENYKESFIKIQNIPEIDESEIGTGDNDTNSGETQSGSSESLLESPPEYKGEDEVKYGGGGGAGGSTYIQEKEIIVQSGLDYVNGTYQCGEERCKINLEYKDSSDETCLWDFGLGEYKDSYINTCNPGFIYYESGEHKISLKIFKDSIFYKSKSLIFKNTYFENLKKNNKKPVANITLQGKLAKYKELNGNKLICKDVKECSVNLTGEESFDENTKKLTFLWDFGNGELFSGDNPPSKKYTPGKYDISLTVIDELGEKDIEYFYVDVIGDMIEDIVIDENIFSNLKISGVLPNNFSIDDYEWFELENIGDEILNLKGIKIDDIVGKGSRAYTLDYNLFLYPDKKKRFYRSKTGLSLGNTNDELNIIYNDKVVDSIKWNFNVPDDFIITHENVDRPLQKVFVERVVDGDTMDVLFENGNKERLRLIGVDTPETKHPRKPVEEFGIEAYNFTKSKLEGKYVLLETGVDDRGKYGRLLAYIYLEASAYTVIPAKAGINKNVKDNLIDSVSSTEGQLVSFNEMLIEKGYARAYLKYPFKYSKKYESLEKQAKKSKVGLWGNKEVLEVIKDWIEEDEEYIEELEKEKLYDFGEIFLNGLNVDELKRKTFLIQNDLVSKLGNTKKNIALKNDWFSASKAKAKNIDEFVELEKELKSSISYRVYKQKKGLKITGNSKEYMEIIMFFDGKKINLKTDENGDFIYYTANISSGDYILEFYGVDDSVGEIFLKNSRTVSLNPEYVENINSYKIKTSSKADNIKKGKVLKLSVVPEVTNEILSSRQSTTLILNLLLGFLVLFFIFLVFRKKGIL